MRPTWTISRYLILAIVPYFVFAWVLLSVVMFVQQAGRFSDIFFSANIPAAMIWQLTVALIPNVIAFTCPMAALVGVIIGLSKMERDSELVAIRAAGVGNLQISLPIALLGIVLSIFTLLINIYGVPFAARVVRQVATQTAIYKLESPIEPGVFNTEVAGYTIYVKDGDITDGRWRNIFIYNEDEKAGTTRLITSSSGRIDSQDEYSELVLENAVAATFSKTGEVEKYVSENIGEIRFAIKTKRGELIEKLRSTELTPEELGLGELSTYASKKEGKERTEARILWQRRIILSITPLIFCIFGTSMILRFHGRGRGFGISVALVSLIVYFLLAFLGEQLARTGRIPVIAAGLLPLIASLAAILWLNVAGRISFSFGITDRIKEAVSGFKLGSNRLQRRNIFVDLTTGLRDFDLIDNLFRYYLLTLTFLAAVFLIFTGFEMWRFAGSVDGGIWLLVKYLFFLVPFIYIQLAPSAAMVAALATYVIKSRQNEIVTWTSAGQSVYRLLLPCVLFMMFLGLMNWGIQEWVAPRANQIQDQLRDQIRGRGIFSGKSGKYWVSSDDRIYSFQIDPGGGSDKENLRSDRASEGDQYQSASDNEMRLMPSCGSTCAVKDLTIYEFVDNGAKLQHLYRSSKAVWERDRLRFTAGATKSTLTEGQVRAVDVTGSELTESTNPFLGIRKKPSHLNSAEVRALLDHTDSDVEKRSFAVALDKKYSTIFLPFVISLFTAPFALSLSRKGKAVTVGYAVGLWLIFMGVTSSFEQMGISGYLPSGIAIWGPLAFFSLLGVYLLSKVKT
jgi:lipopolysaccharide export LptBFGC system permease protein LptF